MRGDSEEGAGGGRRGSPSDGATNRKCFAVVAHHHLHFFLCKAIEILREICRILESFGVSEDDLKANRLSDEFRALMREYGQRARVLYASGERLIPLLDGARSRACCNGLNGGYRTILDAIEDRDYDVFSSRVRPSKPAALLTLGRLWLAGAGSGLSPGGVMRR